jgi:hypothetical protein
MINTLALQGEILSDIQISDNRDEIIFAAKDGRRWRMYHEQDCCESVSIEDICGNIQDLIGTPIVIAEESTGSAGEYGEWTFYNLATVKGYVSIRWYGESAYYSVSVRLSEM